MADQNDEICLGLGLGLGLTNYAPKKDNERKNKRAYFLGLDLSTPLRSSDCGNSYSNSSLKLSIRDEKGQGMKNKNGFSKNYSSKKLRLTSDQSVVLEDTFKQHITLNTAQKLALAEKLNLKPRQVEVWFQNRRARTKLKQMERDSELLKQNCEKLSEENQRLKKELLELRSAVKKENPLAAASLLPPFFYQMPKPPPAIKTCTSCEKMEKSS